MDIKTSVIIPTFNDKDNLRKCLKSTFNTSHNNFEVIVVDDGSDDNPQALSQEFPCKFINLTKNMGQAYARNRGVEAARAEVVLFTDADCQVPKDLVDNISKELLKLHNENNKVVALCCRLISKDKFIEKVHAYAGYAYIQNGQEKEVEYLNTACTAILKYAFIDVGGFSEDMRVSEDPELALKLIEHGYKVIFSPHICIFHDHQVSSMAELLKKHYHWGLELGMKLELKHQKRAGLFLPFLLNPFTNFLTIIPVAVFVTAKVINYNLRYDRKVIFYALHIFLAKVAFRSGILFNIIHGILG